MTSHNIIFANGAIGTMLMALGVSPSGVPDVSRQAPKLLFDLYARYLKAGCTLLTTNTISCGDRADAYDLCQYAMDVVRTAAATVRHHIIIAASIGPTASPDSVSRQATAMSSADFIIAETAISLPGSVATVCAIREALPDSHVIASATVADARHLPDGTNLRHWVAKMSELGIERIGLNCGTHSPTLAEALAYIRDYNPSYFAPSAGTPDAPETARAWAGTVIGACTAGAQSDVPLIVGGCCNTTPEHLTVLINRMTAGGHIPHLHIAR